MPTVSCCELAVWWVSGHQTLHLREKMTTGGDSVTWMNTFGKPAYILSDSPLPINGLHEMNSETSLKLCTDQMLYWPTLHRWEHAVMNRVFL